MQAPQAFQVAAAKVRRTFNIQESLLREEKEMNPSFRVAIIDDHAALILVENRLGVL